MGSRRLSRAEIAVDRSVWVATWMMVWVFFAVQLGVVLSGAAAPEQIAVTVAIGLFAVLLTRSEPPPIHSVRNHAFLGLLSVGVIGVLCGPAGPTGFIGAVFLGPLCSVRLDDRRLIAIHLGVFGALSSMIGLVSVTELVAIVDQPMALAMLLLAVAPAVLAFSCAVTLEAAEAQGDELERLVRRDTLTSVGNRRLMLEVLETELAKHDRQNKNLSVVLLDLNGFKALNDEHGHSAGDELLRRVAVALQGVLGSRDTLTRPGGDEFCIVLPETAADAVPRTVNAIGAALKSIDTVNGPMTAGVGHATFPADAVTVDVLLHVADERLRKNKPEGRRATNLYPVAGAPGETVPDRRKPDQDRRQVD